MISYFILGDQSHLKIGILLWWRGKVRLFRMQTVDFLQRLKQKVVGLARKWEVAKGVGEKWAISTLEVYRENLIRKEAEGCLELRKMKAKALGFNRNGVPLVILRAIAERENESKTPIRVTLKREWGTAGTVRIFGKSGCRREQRKRII